MHDFIIVCRLCILSRNSIRFFSYSWEYPHIRETDKSHKYVYACYSFDKRVLTVNCTIFVEISRIVHLLFRSLSSTCISVYIVMLTSKTVALLRFYFNYSNSFRKKMKINTCRSCEIYIIQRYSSVNTGTMNRLTIRYIYILPVEQDPIDC
jgi:hypothetical protein